MGRPAHPLVRLVRVPSRRSGALPLVTVSVLAASALAAGAAAAVPVSARETGRTETPVASGSPVTEVRESVVRVKIPLPASAGPRPEACDWLSYLRYRHEDGPAASADADRILVAQPGIFEGAGAFDGVARNTVAAAAPKGRYIEFWALDRRSNCLEDRTGVLAGLRAGDVRLAVDYYYRGKEVDGRRFAGYRTNDQVEWLQHVGLEQTVRDRAAGAGLDEPGGLRDRVSRPAGRADDHVGGPVFRWSGPG
ncbi:MAG: hypothetical protein FWJ90_10045 [Actinomadura sp.]